MGVSPEALEMAWKIATQYLGHNKSVIWGTINPSQPYPSIDVVEKKTSNQVHTLTLNQLDQTPIRLKEVC